MTKGQQMKKMLGLLRKADTHDEWNFYLSLMSKAFTISQIELVEDEIRIIESIRKFKTTDLAFEGLHY